MSKLSSVIGRTLDALPGSPRANIVHEDGDEIGIIDLDLGVLELKIRLVYLENGDGLQDDKVHASVDVTLDLPFVSPISMLSTSETLDVGEWIDKVTFGFLDD